MAPRPFWKGYLKLSLVTCPVSMTPATSDSGRLRFHTLNARTGNRVVSRYVDAETGAPVAEEDEVKGYPRSEHEHVVLEDDEIAAVALESTRTIDIGMFVAADSIDWVWYDKPHYLMPDDAIGEEAYAVIRDAMASTGTVGISRLVLYRRERAVMLKPHDRGIVLWTLRYGDELRPERDHFRQIGDAPVDAGLLKLVTRLIGERLVPWDPAMVGDPVQDRLQDIISAKAKGRKRKAKAPDPEPAASRNVVNIMDALKKSIASDSRARRR